MSRLSYHIVNGLQVPTSVTQEEVDKLKDFELYPDDVWIVTFPKCGTTWAQQIVRLIRNNGEQDDVNIDHAVPWLERIKRIADPKVEELQRPRAFKSHFPYNLLPCGPPHTTPCKYIYVARNPKDVAVSLYFHTKLIFFPDIDWDTFWGQYVEGDVGFGNYFDHLLSWWPHRDDKTVLFLKYEDMKKDLPQAVSQIALFVGVGLSSDIITKIADLTSFEKMKNDDTANYSWRERHQGERAPKFLRKGVVGDWKNFLTAEQSSQMDTICAERLKDTGLVFRYE